jgi:hypothetical protein
MRAEQFVKFDELDRKRFPDDYQWRQHLEHHHSFQPSGNRHFQSSSDHDVIEHRDIVWFGRWLYLKRPGYREFRYLKRCGRTSAGCCSWL